MRTKCTVILLLLIVLSFSFSSISYAFDIKDRAQAMNSKLVEWRRHLHANPELKFDVIQTEAFIVQKLKEIGVEKIQQGVAKHGVVALIEGKKPGKVLAIRADMDALQIVEETGLPFAATNGLMHACGHDVHMSSLLGAAELLMHYRDELKGTVKLIFQPSEEGGVDGIGGAQAMIEEGVLENPKVDAIIGLHSGSLWKGAVAGEIGYRQGALMAAVEWINVTFNGKGAHGATPHLSVDPIVMACQAITMLQTIISRELNPLDPAVLSVCMIQGGTAPNVIPQECTIRGTIRTFSPEGRKILVDRFTQICQEVAHAMRGSAKVEIEQGPPPVINERAITEKLQAAAAELLGADKVHEIPEPSMTGEDYSFYLEKVPGTFFFLPTTFGNERDFPHHHPKFDSNEDVIWIGAATLTQFALTWQ
jgi:amidohydrolase